MNYYIILGISPDASHNEIKEAYRRQAQVYHPDHYGLDSSEFLKIQEAYRILSDPEKRRKYDKRFSKRKMNVTGSGRHISHNPEPLIPTDRANRPQPISIIDSFETFKPSIEEIKNRFFGAAEPLLRSKSEQAENLKVEIEINQQQAESGGQVQLLIPVHQICPLCAGSGMIGFWECVRCFGSGDIKKQLPLLISYPTGVHNQFTKSISLRRFGIHHFYLTVIFRISTEKQPS